MLKGLCAFYVLISPLSHASNITPHLLLKTYTDSHDVTGWLMSEKLDGIRALWDGAQLTTRQGNLIHAPDWFINDLPPFDLDGELWTQRHDFETISSIVRQSIPDQRWQTITYNIFEVPKQTGGLLKRLAILETYLQNKPSRFIHIIPQTQVISTTHLDNRLDDVIAEKGEGLVVRHPETPYQTGRSDNALKVKRYSDAECTITGYTAGKGKYVGQTGALTCLLPSEMTILIGSGLSDQQRKTPPTIGSVITYKYYGLTKNKLPRFPVFMRVRTTK
jgi:DNA ligase-1